MDEFFFEEQEEILLNKEALRYPMRQKIKILRFFSCSGVFSRVYWNQDEWDATEKELWKVRKKYRITENSKRCKFCNGYYQYNTLLNQKEVYIKQDDIVISNACVRTDRLFNIFKYFQDYEIKWIQAEESILEMLAADKQLEWQTLGISYIELLNSDNKVLAKQLEQRFGCVVVCACVSELFGYVAYAEKNDDWVMLEQNLQYECQKDGYIELTSLANNVMNISNYEYNSKYFNMKNEDVYVQIGKIRLLKNIFYAPVERINEKNGRIIRQVKIIQDAQENIQIKCFIRKEYWGWQEEIKNMYQQYLERYLDLVVQLQFSFSREWI